MPIINSLDDLERLIQLVKDFKLDAIEIEGIKVTKTLHEFPANASVSKRTNPMDDEDLFYSSQ